MTTLLPPRARAPLPGRNIKPFPTRTASYRALSIIDAYGAELQALVQVQEDPREDGVQAPRSAPGLGKRNAESKDSYTSAFDIDEAYGSGEADLYDDDMEEIINLDDYDPYRSTTPPPRTSSRKPIGLKGETKVEIVEVKPELPPKSKDRKSSLSRKPIANSGVTALASRSEPFLAVFDDAKASPAVPPKDVSMRAVVGGLRAASRSTTTLATPRSGNTDKALPTVPSVPSELLGSPFVRKALPTQPQEVKSLPKKPDENVTSKRDPRKDSLIQSDKGE